MTPHDYFESFRSSHTCTLLHQSPIAYFSAEFALSSLLPTYAGGLGIVAGDMVLEAASQSLPFIGIGMYYPEGYVCKKMIQGGIVSESCTIISPAQAGLSPWNDRTGKRIVVSVPIKDHAVSIQAWVWEKNTAKILFLDTDLPENSPEDKLITRRLYPTDSLLRLKQYMILGIGGMRMLEASGIRPSVYHLNEGHSALLMYEHIRHHIRIDTLSIEDAIQKAKAHVVFTNHTLVPGGNETYSPELISLMFALYSEETGIPLSEIIALGLIDDAQVYSLTHAALRSSSFTNAVSSLHAQEAKTLWPEYTLHPITNGVYVPRWQKGDSTEATHRENKKTLLSHIAKETGKVWNEDTLLIGWARRLVGYKRPLALFEDQEALLTLVSQKDREIRIVLSGFAPPGDEHAAVLFEKLQEVLSGTLAPYVAYLPDYTIDSASLLISGSDIWLNTPMVGFEACGTSGMKAALNGVLPLSTRDGWMAEVDLYGMGWPLEDYATQKSILGTLEHDIVPLYYLSANRWQSMREHARYVVQEQFSATRMMYEYMTKAYLPLIHARK